MKWFNLDLHISVIADVRTILFHLCPESTLTQWSISGHTWVFGESPTPVDVINAKTWRSLDLKMIQQFQQRYDMFLSQFDGFIVTHTPVFTLLYEKYKKPILMVNSCRYEQPFCWNGDRTMQTYLETHLTAMVQSRQLICISNNLADQDYLRLGTGIQSEHIPSLCAYTNAHYQPQRPLFLIKGPRTIFPSSTFKSVAVYVDDALKSGYSWSDMYQYAGIIHIPYEMSTMSIFEQYTANIPLFFPTPELLKLWLRAGRIPFNGPYMKSKFPAVLEPACGSKWIDFWVDRADYYDASNLPHLIYYKSVDHLLTLLKTLTASHLQTISNQMKEFNVQRQFRIYAQWSRMLEACDPVWSLFPSWKFNSDDVITGDGILQWCNAQQDSSLAQYLKTDVLVSGKQIDWRGQLHPSDESLTSTSLLVTGHSDYAISETLYDQYATTLAPQFWAAVNVDVNRARLLPLPLGLTNDCDDSSMHRLYGNVKMMNQVIQRSTPMKKTGMIYCNVNPNTHIERAQVIKLFSQCKFATIGHHAPTAKGRQEFLEAIRSHCFVVCPRGNGPDTHRLWETLYMGAIPILKIETAYQSFVNLPILWVRDWSDLQGKTQDWYRTQYHQILQHRWHLSKLSLTYWRTVLQSLLPPLPILSSVASDETPPMLISSSSSLTLSSESVASTPSVVNTKTGVVQDAAKPVMKLTSSSTLASSSTSSASTAVVKGTWDSGDAKGYAQSQLSDTGQIQDSSGLGQLLQALVEEPDVHSILEVGTWNGRGSTRCIMNGLKARKDSQFVFYSLECNADKNKDARMYYASQKDWPSFESRVFLLNEVLSAPPLSAIQQIFPDVKNNTSSCSKWCQTDQSNIQSCPLFLSSHKNLPSIFDVVFLDGGEFTTYFDFQMIDTQCYALVLDDIQSNKCKLIFEFLNAHSDEWYILHLNQEDRNGYLMALHRSILPKQHPFQEWITSDTNSKEAKP